MNTTIKNKQGELLDYAFETGAADQKKSGWIAVLGHGVTGNNERPVVVDPAAALAAAGFDTLRFSFAGNGNSGGDFRDATISKEVDDLGSVLDAVSGSYQKIAYLGHSMGGAVGVLRAAKDDRIKALVSLAGMVDTKAFAETEFGEETPDEGLMWEDEDCPLSSQFMQDLTETIGSVAPQVGQVKVPWLLVHGSADDVVLPKDTDQVETIKGEAVKVLRIEGADHSFNEAAHKTEMIQALVKWLSSQT
jgi:alpha/beta superfamily hydrolase